MARILTLLLPGTILLNACGAFDGTSGRNRRSTDIVDQDQRRRDDKKQQAEKACDTAAVQRISRPYWDGSTDTFEYAFEYHAASSPNLPTVVYIPGGPGQTSIGESEDWLSRLPAGYGVVLTDPRGVGCNANPDVKEGED